MTSFEARQPGCRFYNFYLAKTQREFAPATSDSKFTPIRHSGAPTRPCRISSAANSLSWFFLLQGNSKCF